jgi:SNF2 family DNA or RNA helicase
VCRKHAIGAAVLKKELFGYTKTLVICPASLKSQWKKEIEKFTELKAEIVQGLPDERELQYIKNEAYFLIINYETVLRDQVALNKAKINFLILDEAQKVKNYATKSASAIKNISRKHVLIITGTPIENKLIDLFSLMTILDPHLLGPLWEFSYKHCLFDHHKPNKINAYYNLSSLKEELKPVLLRREKHKVLTQLPNVQQHDIPIGMTTLQAYFHASYASGIGQIINKRFMTAFDLQRLQQLLTGMRMTCDSTYLIDESTNDSPKLEELKYILLEKIDLKKQPSQSHHLFGMGENAQTYWGHVA